MPNPPKVVEVITSGVPELVREVHVFDSTREHIKTKHRREYERWEDVRATIEDPTRVHKSKTHPTSIIFVNDKATSPGGDPMRVPVKVMSTDIGIMSTANFTSAKDQGDLLWVSSDAT